jgi:Pentapeptide repeats (8 copies)
MEHLPPHRHRPESWNEFRRRSAHLLFLPLLWIDWWCRYLAFYLSRWAFLEVLEYLGSLSVLFAVILYFTEAGERRQQKHYQAWQVINTAQGKGGNGGRIDALQELNADDISLIGVDLDEAFLQSVILPAARLDRATFHNADVRQANLRNAELQWVHFISTNLRAADLRKTDLTHANISSSDLSDADLSGANVDDVNFDDTDLVNANLAGLMNWKSIASMHRTNIHGIQNAPAGFTQWALAHGAVDTPPADQ